MQTPGEPRELSVRALQAGAERCFRGKPRLPRDCWWGAQVPLPPQLLVWAVSGIRKQQLRFGSEGPSVQGLVGAIWAKMPMGQLDTKYLISGQALKTEPSWAWSTVEPPAPPRPSVYTG